MGGPPLSPSIASARLTTPDLMATAGDRLRTVLCTALALVAFAANSVLCRLALGGSAIDAASFSTIRLVSGAAILLLIVTVVNRGDAPQRSGNWASATALFLYAVTFSFAYISLNTATGALILFGAVQATMIVGGLWAGERPHLLEWLGLAVAVIGFGYLVFPGLAAPSPTGSALMAVAGIAWGIYSLRGRGQGNALANTTANFVRSLPLVLGVSLIALPRLHISPEGVVLAMVSGALASGMGYVLWYAALRGLTATRAATVQLSVPILAALGGVVFLAETISLRLLLAAILILGGIALAVLGRDYLVRVSAME